jgi:hypothetical protein
MSHASKKVRPFRSKKGWRESETLPAEIVLDTNNLLYLHTAVSTQKHRTAGHGNAASGAEGHSPCIVQATARGPPSDLRENSAEATKTQNA